jgi:hypothetical protein
VLRLRNGTENEWTMQLFRDSRQSRTGKPIGKLSQSSTGILGMQVQGVPLLERPVPFEFTAGSSTSFRLDFGTCDL